MKVWIAAQTLLLLLISCGSLVSAQRAVTGVPDIPPAERQFRVVYEWKTLDFTFPSDKDRINALYSGEYVPQNVLMSDVKPHGTRLYLTLPRMLPGVPATLGWVIAPDNNGRTDPLITPFPSWEMNQKGNCSALQFVQGIDIDSDGILWAIDSGRTETLAPSPGATVCRPKLVLFDLKQNGSLVGFYVFPEEVVPIGANYLNKIVVDEALGGYAYITDNSGADPGIVVYSRRLNQSWKVREPNSMRAAPNAVAFSVAGQNLNFSINIDAIALGPFHPPPPNQPPNDALSSVERTVYYSPLSSYHLYSLPASLLRDPEFARRATLRQVFEAVNDLGVKASQTDGMIMDNQGVLYFGLLREHAIAQWDSFTPFVPENQVIVAKDDYHIQWTDGMGFDEFGYLYVVVNRLHNFVAGRLNVNDVNFRILRSRTGTVSYVYATKSAGDVGLPPANAFFPTSATPTIGPTINQNDIEFGIASSTPISLGSVGGSGSRYNSATTAVSASFLQTIVPLIVSVLLVNVRL